MYVCVCVCVSVCVCVCVCVWCVCVVCVSECSSAPIPRQDAYIAEREEAWSKVEKLAIQSPHYHKLAHPEAITAKMVFPRMEPMETVPERQLLPQMLREPVAVVERERQMEVVGGGEGAGEGTGGEGVGSGAAVGGVGCVAGGVADWE